MPQRHVIIVGAGVGGLSAAFDLASRGVRVTVIEQHAHAGGKMRQIAIGDHRIDSGPTVFTMRWIFDDLFAEAGHRLDEHLTLLPADLLARHGWTDGSRLDLFADVNKSAAAIAAFSGQADADAYRAFARDSGRIFETLDTSFMRAQRPSQIELAQRVGLRGLPRLLATKPFVSLWRDLDKRFSDPRLKQLFARYSTYCGSSPFKAPATLQLIAHAERAGVWYVEGGMQALAETLAARAEDAGAEFLFNSKVAGILEYDGRITGVNLANGDVVMGDAVIFAGDCAALVDGLLGKTVTKAVPPLPRDKRSLSAITWSMVAEVRGFPLAHHTVLFGDDYVDEFDSIFERQTICRSPTIYLCAQSRQDETLPPSRDAEPLLVLINAPARALSAQELDAAEGYMLDNLARGGLTLSYAPGDAVVTQPEDFARLFPATDGALYGRPTHGAMGSFSRPGGRTRMEGLYLAGGSVHPGAGVPMTAMSGRLAAACVRSDLRLD
ncbi:MAG: 1-hydroxycarotenoid 3,4-desaturase CrtD [Pseudomonadota bacterium]